MELFNMWNVVIKELTKRLMFAMLIMAGGASVAGATAFSADPGGVTCPGNITIQADGSVTCATGGELQSKCTGEIIIDSKGVVRCKTKGVRICTLKVAGIAAGTTTIKAECSPAATTYIWNDAQCLQSSATCGVKPATDKTYTVTGKDASGTSIGSASLAVKGTTAQPGSQPSCSLTASPSSISAGGSSTLTAICSPTANYTWAWSGGTCTGNATNTCTVSPTVTTGYTVTAQSSAGKGAANATVSVAAPSVTGKPECKFKRPPVSTAGMTWLDAVCNPEAETFSWSGAGCESEQGRICGVNPTVTTTYTVTGSTVAYGAGNTDTITINVAAPTPTTPNCTLKASQSSIAPGDTSMLTAECSPVATSYTWTGGTCADKVTTNVKSDTVIGTTVEVTSTATAYMEIGDELTIAGNSGFSIIAITGNVLTFTPATTAVTTKDATVTANKAATCTVTPATTTEYTVVGKNSVGEGNPAKATVSVTAPTCTLTVAPKEIDKGGTSTLTAVCTPAATEGYTWTGGTCAVENTTTNTCTVTPSVTTEYTVTGKNSVGKGDPVTGTVEVMAPKCTLIANPLSIAPGGSSTLTAVCKPAATEGYTWTGGTCAELASTNTCTVTPSVTTVYTVTGKNSSGTGAPGSATVSIIADPGCPAGYSDKIITINPLTWAPNMVYTGPLQIMNHCERHAYQFSVQELPPGEPYDRSLTVYANVRLYMSLSQTAFDFSPELEKNFCADYGVNDPQIRSAPGGGYGYCPVVVGGLYYLNVRNAESFDGPDVCPAGLQCSFRLAW